MLRKIIYIIIFILTIALVVTEHYNLLDLNKEATRLESITDAIDDTVKEVELTANLIIKNNQNDEKNLTYSYKITIENISGAQLAIKDTTEDYIVFAANGTTEITLNSNEEITFKNLPDGAKYKIEQTTDVSDKYTTSINEVETSVIEGILEVETRVEFDNETIKQETVKKNPYTADNHYLVLFVFIYAIIIVGLAMKLKIKRFE